jgi:hypothetical protein
VAMPVVPASCVRPEDQGPVPSGMVMMPVVPTSSVGVGCRPVGTTLNSHRSAARVNDSSA